MLDSQATSMQAVCFSKVYELLLTACSINSIICCPGLTLTNNTLLFTSICNTGHIFVTTCYMKHDSEIKEHINSEKTNVQHIRLQ